MVLAQALHLEEIDLTGDNNVGDEGISFLPRGEVKREGQPPHIVGL